MAEACPAHRAPGRLANDGGIFIFVFVLASLYSFEGMPIGDASQPLFDALTRLKQSWPARGWSWDSRFIALASTFTVPYETQARRAAAVALSAEYTSTTLSSAPPELRDLAARTGGLRSGQLLLAGGPIGGITAFGLWWPWGDGETISMRVGLLDIDPNREPWRRLRDTFNVTM